MSEWEKAPEFVVVDFLREDIAAVTQADLGEQFLKSLGIETYEKSKPFKVAVEKKLSKAENAYYEFSQNGIPFPDGLGTFLRVEGVIIPMGKVHPSKTSKNPTREGEAIIVIGNQLYNVTAYLTEAKSGFYVKLIALKKSKPKSSNTPIKGAHIL